ncbi:MAG: hypothetical protein Q7K26_01565 [bacterium]|nr:hypothetical protein [bacterium]
MDQEEIEALIKAMIESGEAETGLYNAGLQYVVVDVVNDGKADKVTFQWFGEMKLVDDLVWRKSIEKIV